MAKPKIPKNVAVRAEAVEFQVESGATVRDIGGKRLRHDRTVVSVPIGRSWRVVVRDHGDRLEYVGVMSHEDYSRGAKVGRR